MAVPAPFDITTELLERLLEEAHDGRIQVPEFQRESSLDDDGIKSLLASVSLGYPIGAMTLLDAGNPDVRFETHPIAGAPASSTEPERLLIDGQHRMSSLYQVLASGRAVQLQDDQKKPTPRWYYLDIHAALDPDADRDDAITSVPDLGTPEFEFERCLFPLRLVFCGNGERRRWQRGFATHGTPEESEAKAELMDRFAAEVLEVFDDYVVPTIIVGQENARWSVRVHGGPEGPSLSDRFRH